MQRRLLAPTPFRLHVSFFGALPSEKISKLLKSFPSHVKHLVYDSLRIIFMLHVMTVLIILSILNPVHILESLNSTIIIPCDL